MMNCGSIKHPSNRCITRMFMDAKLGLMDEILSMWIEMHMEVVGSVLIYMNKSIMACDKHIPWDIHVVEIKVT